MERVNCCPLSALRLPSVTKRQKQCADEHDSWAKLFSLHFSSLILLFDLNCLHSAPHRDECGNWKWRPARRVLIMRLAAFHLTKAKGPTLKRRGTWTKRDLSEEGPERRRRRDSDNDNNNGNNIGIDARNGGSGGVLRNFALNQWIK